MIKRPSHSQVGRGLVTNKWGYTGFRVLGILLSRYRVSGFETLGISNVYGKARSCGFGLRSDILGLRVQDFDRGRARAQSLIENIDRSRAIKGNMTECSTTSYRGSSQKNAAHTHYSRILRHNM